MIKLEYCRFSLLVNALYLTMSLCIGIQSVSRDLLTCDVIIWRKSNGNYQFQCIIDSTRNLFSILNDVIIICALLSMSSFSIHYVVMVGIYHVIQSGSYCVKLAYYYYY